LHLHVLRAAVEAVEVVTVVAEVVEPVDKKTTDKTSGEKPF
jgi:hypothetical protein